MIMNAIYYTLAVAWKEIQLIARERTWLVILFLLPLLIGSFMGGANLAVSRAAEDIIELKVGLVNQDEGTYGTEMVKKLHSIEQLKITEYKDATDAEEQVAKGKVYAVILIPGDFSQNIDGYTPTKVMLVVDPAEPIAASLITGIMKQVAAGFTIQGEVQYGVRTIFEEAGILSAASPQEVRALEEQNRGVIMTRINEMRTDPVIAVSVDDPSNEESGPPMARFFAYLFPGLTVMFIYFIVAMSSGALLSERDTGTLRRLLTATIPKGAILAGKMLAYMLLACLQVVVMLTVASLVFSTPLGRSLLGLIVVTIVVAFNATALGLMIAALAKTTKQAESLGLIMAFVLAGLGGALPMGPTPLYRAGGAIAVIASIIPHSHAVEGFYRLMAENSGFAQVLPQIGILLGMGVIFFLVALWRFRFDK
jgi:ABC-2 type transport system permease protein